jgi:lipopolysaccharide biosynthesis protein
MNKTKRITIFAHYDKDNIVDDYVIFYLEGLKKVCDEIIFVSDCNLTSEQTNKISHLCSNIIFERHGEYDFGSYKRGIISIENRLNEFDELLIANDSCYLVNSLEPVFEQMNQKNCDFWGLTQSKERNDIYYVGSYFINFKKNVFSSNVFLDFFKSITKLNSKDDIIGNYEVGLTRLLLKNRFNSESFIRKADVMPLMSSLSFKLIKNNGFPFIKIALLRDNPFGDGKVDKWKSYCNKNEALTIEKHLKRFITKKQIHNTNNRALSYFNYSLLHRNFINVNSKNGKIRIKALGLTILKI